ncbi:anthranilate synthase component I [Brevibacterium sp. 5221]|uniref:Anthranilate synthase component 1 n=1 Tax=Brevibacterium rongguiense TaxID=2695267 RepID=A0A6N9H9M2_9MICO|nr:chorismate-binding protein [Brevibacterium rongguiense]MYM20531.1 anthranilate synthase component I [Brevibacterium rongguiense]
MTISPDFEAFAATAAAGTRLIPVHTRVLADGETPLGVYRRIAQGRPGGFLLESAHQGTWNRYSFIGRDPIATLTADADGRAVWLGTPIAGTEGIADPIAGVSALLELLAAPRHPELPPMISSLVGYLGWDVVRRFERLGQGPLPEGELPELSLSVPGDVVIVDHQTSELTLVANAINADGRPTGLEAAYADARARIGTLLEDLRAPLAPVLEVADFPDPEVKTRTEPGDYLAAVAEAQRRIVDGDIFQVVLGQRFDAAADARPLDVYRMLRRLNPSPYMYLFDVPTSDGAPLAVVGSSPEALVTVDRGTVIAHPIAGSRPRGAGEEEDAALARELAADAKERAEHLMLVDLARNDLAKVCEPGTVDVVEFMEIERFSHIMHLVSTVTGTLAPGCTGVDVLRATFPAGTLSGAPKPMALQIIDELEPVARGLYGGVVGYLSFSGDLDMAIAIRTGVMRPGVLSVYAGGGIVADSDPHSEYAESQHKAAAVLRAAAAAATLRAAAPARDAAGAESGQERA